MCILRDQLLSFPTKIEFLSLKVVLAIANSVDPDKIEFLYLKIVLAIENSVDPEEIEFLSLKIILVIANSADPDEMQHYAAFHLGLLFLPKYLFRGFQYTKG